MPRDLCRKDSLSTLNNPFLIHHSRPTVDDEDIQAVASILRTNEIVQGECVAAFEKAMSEYIGTKGGVAVNSGTSALHLTLLALNVQEGDEVIIPSYVCSALLNAIRYVKASPCFVEIDRDTFNLDPKDVRCKIGRQSKAIIVPHLFGLSAEMDELVRYGVPVIEDCAQSPGAIYCGRKVGTMGMAAVFSFYATKMFTTGEGGMVLSDSTELLERIRDLRDYDGKDDSKVRFNYKMTDFQASLGMSQLSKLPEFIDRRRKIALRYSDGLKPIGSIALPKEPSGMKHIYYRYVVKTKKDVESAVIQFRREGIETAKPVHKPLHHSLSERRNLAVTDETWKTALSLPIYPSLCDRDVDLVMSKAGDILG